jgi:undecaprenyl-diphosphatase
VRFEPTEEQHLMTTWFLRLNTHDERALHALVLRRRSWIDAAMCTITHLGGATITIAAAALLLAVGPAHSGLIAAVALAASHLMVQLLKRSVARPRPRLPVGIESLVRAPDRFSFPSGHAAAALSIALPLALTLPPMAGAVLIGLALAIGLSRCYLGIHFPGDVAAGWVLAAAAVLLAHVALVEM